MSSPADREIQRGAAGEAAEARVSEAAAENLMM